MDKCGCYCVEKTTTFLSQFEQGVIFAKTGEIKETMGHTVGRCNGTREREICNCGGDQSKCDFYEYKRACAHIG